MKRFLGVLIFALLFVGEAFAATADKAEVLYDEIDITADDESGWECFDQRTDAQVFEAIVTHNSGSSTMDVTVITKHDDLAESEPIITFTQFTTSSTSERKTLNPTVIPLRCLKVVVDVGASGSPNYDLVVRMLYRNTL
jgi:hypothetical protein